MNNTISIPFSITLSGKGSEAATCLQTPIDLNPSKKYQMAVTKIHLQKAPAICKIILRDRYCSELIYFITDYSTVDKIKASLSGTIQESHNLEEALKKLKISAADYRFEPKIITDIATYIRLSIINSRAVLELLSDNIMEVQLSHEIPYYLGFSTHTFTDKVTAAKWRLNKQPPMTFICCNSKIEVN